MQAYLTIVWKAYFW